MPESKKTKIIAWLKDVGLAFRKALNPEGYVCYVCGKELDEKHREHSLCEKCLGKLPYRQAETCPVCGKYVTRPGPCVACNNANLPYKKAYAPFDYSGSIRSMVVNYKDRSKPWLHTYIAKFLIDYAKGMELKGDYIVYVPSSEQAIKRRGFEHNKKIAEALANALDIPLIEPLRRVFQKKDSRNLTTEERYANVRGAFVIKDGYDRTELIGKSILLIDDVMSSGATITTCAQVLKLNGVREINLLTLARS